MAQVLVTGGAGFIGSHLVEALVEQGHRVKVLDDLSTGRLENLRPVQSQIVFEQGSIENVGMVEQAASGCRYVFHLAAIVSVPLSISDPLGTHSVNATGTLNVITAARNVGARLIYSSSAAVYGDSEPPLFEDSPKNPISAYGAQKLYGENLVYAAARNGLEGVSLRYFNVYGPRQDPESPYSGVISIFMDKVLRGEMLSIHGDGKQTRDFVHVSDVVRANLLAMTTRNANGMAVNVGTGTATNLLQLAQLVYRAAGRITAMRHEPARTGDVRKSYSDPCMARQNLGFSAVVPLDKGLPELVRSWSASSAR